MPDLKHLDSFAAETRTRVVPPDFDSLLTVSRRRRRTAVLGSAAAAAAVIAVAGIGAHAVYDDQSAPVGPSKTPPSTQQTRLTGDRRAAAIIDSPDAARWATAVLPDHPDSMAVVWQSGLRGYALAVTADGFAHRSGLLLRRGLDSPVPDVEAAGPDSFYVTEPGARTLVSPDGASRPVRLSRSPGPLEAGEYIVPDHLGTVAVNPTTGTAHPLTLPADAREVYGGQRLIWTIASPPPAGTGERFHQSVDWSTDGGRTWSSHPLPSGSLAIFERVPSPPDTMAVAFIGDVTLPTLSQVIVSRDAGQTWQVFDPGAHITAPFAWTAATSDGRLLVSALEWSHKPETAADPQSAGLLASDGSDWADVSPVETRMSDGQSVSIGFSDLATTTTDHGSLLLFITLGNGPEGGPLMSDDGGTTWTEVRDR